MSTAFAVPLALRPRCLLDVFPTVFSSARSGPFLFSPLTFLKGAPCYLR